ncbi:MAG: GNAT family N-acetyltransferase, partial [Candidatus Omnitrophica bacterium]|nr:GNAT family N-acetyltransferase [Candidatus Omnitrophota bacterium]
MLDHKRSIRIISILILFIFTHQQIGWVQEGKPVWASLSDLEKAVSHNSLGEIDIPYDLGEVTDASLDGGNNFIINVQDAHASLSAQHSIASILDTLVRNYDIELLALEGSDGYIDTSILKTFPNKEARDNTARYLMREGKLSAGEFFSITRDDVEVTLCGVENQELYRANLESFRAIMGESALNISGVRALKDQLEALSEKIYSPEMKKLESASRAHRLGELGFSDYWKSLSALARQKGIDTGRFENISRLLEAVAMEKNIDFLAANRERKELIDTLSDVMDRQDLEAVVLKSLLFKQGKLSPAAFHAYLGRLAVAYGIDPSEFKNLISYTHYISVYRSIDIVSLYTEIGGLEGLIREKSYTCPDEKEVYKWSRICFLLEKLFKAELSNEEAESLASLREACRADACAGFIKDSCGRYGVAISGGYDINDIFSAIDGAMDFYRLAEERNESMIRNTLFNMKKEGTRVAALVTGGFHSKGLTELLRDKSLSYLVVVPKFEKGKERPYVAVLTNKKKPYRELLDAGRYQLAVSAYFRHMNEGKFLETAIPLFASDLAGGADWKTAAGKWRKEYALEYERLRAEDPEKVEGSLSLEEFDSIVAQMRLKLLDDGSVVVERAKDGDLTYFLMTSGEDGVPGSPRVLPSSRGEQLMRGKEELPAREAVREMQPAVYTERDELIPELGIDGPLMNEVIEQFMGAARIDRDRVIRTIRAKTGVDIDEAAMSPELAEAIDEFASAVKAAVTAGAGEEQERREEISPEERPEEEEAGRVPREGKEEPGGKGYAFREPGRSFTPLVSVLGAAGSIVLASLFLSGKAMSAFLIAAFTALLLFNAGFFIVREYIIVAVRKGLIMDSFYGKANVREVRERAKSMFDTIRRSYLSEEKARVLDGTGIKVVNAYSPERDIEILGNAYARLDKKDNKVYLADNLARAPDWVLGLVLSHEIAHAFTTSETAANIFMIWNLLRSVRIITYPSFNSRVYPVVEIPERGGERKAAEKTRKFLENARPGEGIEVEPGKDIEEAETLLRAVISSGKQVSVYRRGTEGFVYFLRVDDPPSYEAVPAIIEEVKLDQDLDERRARFERFVAEGKIFAAWEDRDTRESYAYFFREGAALPEYASGTGELEYLGKILPGEDASPFYSLRGAPGYEEFLKSVEAGGAWQIAVHRGGILSYKAPLELDGQARLELFAYLKNSVAGREVPDIFEELGRFGFEFAYEDKNLNPETGRTLYGVSYWRKKLTVAVLASLIVIFSFTIAVIGAGRMGIKASPQETALTEVEPAVETGVMPEVRVRPEAKVPGERGESPGERVFTDLSAAEKEFKEHIKRNFGEIVYGRMIGDEFYSLNDREKKRYFEGLFREAEARERVRLVNEWIDDNWSRIEPLLSGYMSLTKSGETRPASQQKALFILRAMDPETYGELEKRGVALWNSGLIPAGGQTMGSRGAGRWGVPIIQLNSAMEDNYAGMTFILDHEAVHAGQLPESFLEWYIGRSVRMEFLQFFGTGMPQNEVEAYARGTEFLKKLINVESAGGYDFGGTSERAFGYIGQKTGFAFDSFMVWMLNLSAVIGAAWIFAFARKRARVKARFAEKVEDYRSEFWRDEATGRFHVDSLLEKLAMGRKITSADPYAENEIRSELYQLLRSSGVEARVADRELVRLARSTVGYGRKRKGEDPAETNERVAGIYEKMKLVPEGPLDREGMLEVRKFFEQDDEGEWDFKRGNGIALIAGYGFEGEINTELSKIFKALRGLEPDPAKLYLTDTDSIHVTIAGLIANTEEIVYAPGIERSRELMFSQIRQIASKYGPLKIRFYYKDLTVSPKGEIIALGYVDNGELFAMRREFDERGISFRMTDIVHATIGRVFDEKYRPADFEKLKAYIEGVREVKDAYGQPALIGEVEIERLDIWDQRGATKNLRFRKTHLPVKLYPNRFVGWFARFYRRISGYDRARGKKLLQDGLEEDPGDSDHAVMLFKMGISEKLRRDIVSYLRSKGFDVARIRKSDGPVGMDKVLTRWGKGSGLEFGVKSVGRDGIDTEEAFAAMEENDGKRFMDWFRKVEKDHGRKPSVKELKYSIDCLNRSVETVIVRYRGPRSKLVNDFGGEDEYSSEELEQVPFQDLFKKVVVGATHAFKADPRSIRGHLIKPALTETGHMRDLYRLGLKMVPENLIGLIANGVHCPKKEELFAEIDDYLPDRGDFEVFMYEEIPAMSRAVIDDAVISDSAGISELSNVMRESGGRPIAVGRVKRVIRGQDEDPGHRHSIKVCRLNGNIVGYAYIVESLSGGKITSTHIDQVAVAVDHRRRNIARALIAQIINEGVVKGCGDFTLDAMNPAMEKVVSPFEFVREEGMRFSLRGVETYVHGVRIGIPHDILEAVYKRFKNRFELPKYQHYLERNSERLARIIRSYGKPAEEGVVDREALLARLEKEIAEGVSRVRITATIPFLRKIFRPIPLRGVSPREYALKYAPVIEETLFFSVPMIFSYYFLGASNPWTSPLMAFSRMVFFFAHGVSLTYSHRTGYETPLRVAVWGFAFSQITFYMLSAGYLQGLISPVSAIIAMSIFPAAAHLYENFRALDKGLAPASIQGAEEAFRDEEKLSAEEREKLRGAYLEIDRWYDIDDETREEDLERKRSAFETIADYGDDRKSISRIWKAIREIRHYGLEEESIFSDALYYAGLVADRLVRIDGTGSYLPVFAEMMNDPPGEEFAALIEEYVLSGLKKVSSAEETLEKIMPLSLACSALEEGAVKHALKRELDRQLSLSTTLPEGKQAARALAEVLRSWKCDEQLKRQAAEKLFIVTQSLRGKEKGLIVTLPLLGDLVKLPAVPDGIKEDIRQRMLDEVKRIDGSWDPLAVIPFLVKGLSHPAVSSDSEMKKEFIRALTRLKRIPLKAKDIQHLHSSIIGMVNDSMDEVFGKPPRGEHRKGRIYGSYGDFKIQFSGGTGRDRVREVLSRLRRRFSEANVEAEVSDPGGDPLTVAVKVKPTTVNLTALWRILGTQDFKIDGEGNYRKFTRQEIIQKLRIRAHMLFEGIEEELSSMPPGEAHDELYEKLKQLRFYFYGDGTEYYPGVVQLLKYPERIREIQEHEVPRYAEDKDPGSMYYWKSLKVINREGRKYAAYGDSLLIRNEALERQGPEADMNWSSIRDAEKIGELNPYFAYRLEMLSGEGILEEHKRLTLFEEPYYTVFLNTRDLGHPWEMVPEESGIVSQGGVKRYIYMARAAGSIFNTSYLLNLLRSGAPSRHKMFLLSRDTIGGYQNLRNIIHNKVMRPLITDEDYDASFYQIAPQILGVIHELYESGEGIGEGDTWKTVLDSIWDQVESSHLLEGVSSGEHVVAVDEFGRGTYDFMLKYIIERKTFERDKRRYEREVREARESSAGLPEKRVKQIIEGIREPRPVYVSMFIGHNQYVSKFSVKGYPVMKRANLVRDFGITGRRADAVTTVVSDYADASPHPLRVRLGERAPVIAREVPVEFEDYDVLMNNYLLNLFLVNGVVEFHDSLAFNAVARLFLEDEDPDVRKAAASALSAFAMPELDDKAREILRSRAEKSGKFDREEEDPGVREAMERSYLEIAARQMKEELDLRPSDSGEYIVYGIKDIKGFLGKIRVLLDAVSSPFERVRALAFQALSSLDSDIAVRAGEISVEDIEEMTAAILQRRSVMEKISEKDIEKGLEDIADTIVSARKNNMSRDDSMITVAGLIGAQASGKSYLAARLSRKITDRMKGPGRVRAVDLADGWLLGYARRESDDIRGMFGFNGATGFVNFMRNVRRGREGLMPFFDAGKRQRVRLLDTAKFTDERGVVNENDYTYALSMCISAIRDDYVRNYGPEKEQEFIVREQEARLLRLFDDEGNILVKDPVLKRTVEECLDRIRSLNERGAAAGPQDLMVDITRRKGKAFITGDIVESVAPEDGDVFIVSGSLIGSDDVLLPGERGWIFDSLTGIWAPPEVRLAREISDKRQGTYGPLNEKEIISSFKKRLVGEMKTIQPGMITAHTILDNTSELEDLIFGDNIGGILSEEEKIELYTALEEYTGSAFEEGYLIDEDGAEALSRAFAAGSLAMDRFIENMKGMISVKA